MEVSVKAPISIEYIQKLLVALFGTSNVHFANGNLNDLRASNIIIK